MGQRCAMKRAEKQFRLSVAQGDLSFQQRSLCGEEESKKSSKVMHSFPSPSIINALPSPIVNSSLSLSLGSFRAAVPKAGRLDDSLLRIQLTACPWGSIIKGYLGVKQGGITSLARCTNDAVQDGSWTVHSAQYRSREQERHSRQALRDPSPRN